MFQIFEDEDYVYVNAFIPGRPSISLNCTESKEVFLLGKTNYESFFSMIFTILTPLFF